jgi:RNA polymerase sigma-70 factor (ECF subfamily)
MGYSNAIEARWMPGMPLTSPPPSAASARAVTSSVARGAAPVPVPAVDPQHELSALVARMVEGDELALTEFYDRTVAKVYGLALRIVGIAALAEEVVVDTYHQAWREVRRYDGARGVPMAWLLMMCRSRALDALRSRDPAIPHEDPASLVDDTLQPRDADPLELLTAIEAHSALHAALVRLSPQQRQMVALAFFRGLTHEEIAAHAALPLGTVKSQIRRALDVLRRALAHGEGDER